MKIASQFALALPASRAYSLLVDLDQVAPCLPGATLGPTADNGARQVEMTVKLGPMAFRYRGEVAIVERDDDSRRAVLRGTARELKGQGSAQSDIAMSVTEDGAGGSQVDVEAQVDLSGRAAQIGGGMVEAVADRLIEDMVQCLRRRFVDVPEAVTREPASAEPAGAGASTAPAGDASTGRPLRGGALLLRVLRDKLARLLRVR